MRELFSKLSGDILFLLPCFAKLTLTSAGSLFVQLQGLRPRNHRSKSCACFGDDKETLMMVGLSVGTAAYSISIYDRDLARASKSACSMVLLCIADLGE
jgi:hypothetical protein